MAEGPKFKVLYEFKGSRGVNCRIVTEDEKKPGMARGESWDSKAQVWRQWLQSTEANLVLATMAERDALKAELDALKAEKKA